MIDHKVILFQMNETVEVQLPNLTTVRIQIDERGLPQISTHDPETSEGQDDDHN